MRLRLLLLLSALPWTARLLAVPLLPLQPLWCRLACKSQAMCALLGVRRLWVKLVVPARLHARADVGGEADVVVIGPPKSNHCMKPEWRRRVTALLQVLHTKLLRRRRENSSETRMQPSLHLGRCLVEQSRRTISWS